MKAASFRLCSDHRCCYDHKAYAQARACLTEAYLRADGFVMITGSAGTGETTLIVELMETLADESAVAAI